MTTLEIALSCTTTIFFLATLWLLNEFRKKFTFMDDFWKLAGNLGREYWLDAVTSPHGLQQRGATDGKPGMNTFMFSSNEAFTALIGFRLEVPWWLKPLFRWIFGRTDGFDYYGQVASRYDETLEKHVAYATTWFGEEHCSFRFLFSQPGVRVELNEVALAAEGDPSTPYHNVSDPHFYQKWLGWYT